MFHSFKEVAHIRKAVMGWWQPGTYFIMAISQQSFTLSKPNTNFMRLEVILSSRRKLKHHIAPLYTAQKS